MSHSHLTHRRVQNSSCDECRRARVACDAGRARRSSVDSHALVTCTRCINRQRECTFQWLKQGPAKSAAPRITSHERTRALRARPQKRSPEHGNVGEPDVSEEPPSTVPPARLTSESKSSQNFNVTTADPTSPLEHEWLQIIYEKGFETVFGSWMGRHSNPFACVALLLLVPEKADARPDSPLTRRSFGEKTLADVISIHRLCRQLDKWMDEEEDRPSTSSDAQINQFLDHAIQAYAARWLPLIPKFAVPSHTCAEMVKDLWRCAHRDMLKVINRPAYRSMLTLLLFALTPIPVGISEDEELDGVSGQVCVHAALQQIQTLRARQRSLQFNGTRVNLTSPNWAPATSPPSLATTSFISAESTAYWAALTFDTSASLTMSCRPLLSSGLFGFDLEPSWRMVRTCMEIFREMTKEWPDAEFDMTDDRANIIISAGAGWKLLVWKLTANLKESLRDGHDEPEVLRAFGSVSESIDRFNATYRDLLMACQRRIHFFSQETKLRWYELMLHYHLCILMVVDIATATGRDDLLSHFSAKMVEAETWVLNCLVFGLNNRYTLVFPAELTSSEPNTPTGPSPSIAVPLVAIDPYPHHVVAAVKLMQQAIERDFAAAKITADAYRSLLSTLTQTLEHLPQCSKSVQSAREELLSQPLYG